VHSGAAPVSALFAINPKVKILWAHAGFSAPPVVVGELLDRYAQLWTEVSYRAEDIAPNGDLDPAWEALLLRHSDRFMIGTDTWTAWRWPLYVGLIQQHRAWLRQLPNDVAEKIAHRNAARLFGQ
jgi:predicted TIM-barrel fold metal-dependent hydrolase